MARRLLRATLSSGCTRPSYETGSWPNASRLNEVDSLDLLNVEAINKMLKLLERIEKNTEHKSSFYLIVDGQNSRIRTKYAPLIELDRDMRYEMALVNLETYYSFPNIDANNNNLFEYSHDEGVTWTSIIIPEGSYEITNLNDYIQTKMKANGHYDTVKNEYTITLKPNTNTLKCGMIVGKNYKVRFTAPNSLKSMLGFTRDYYLEGYSESENIVNILNIASLRVTSDIISSSYVNGLTDCIIYQFYPNVAPGYKIVETPINLIYLPITLNTISQMETRLIDQNGKLVNLRGENLSIRFHIREV